MMINNRGFTLIELMIVICIIAILASTAVLPYLFSRPERELKNAAAQLYRDLQEAKSKAVLNRTNTQITFNKNANTYTVNTNGTPRTVSLQGFGNGITYGQGPAVSKYTTSLDPNYVPGPISGDYITFPDVNNQPTVGFQLSGLLSTPRGGYVYLTNSETNDTCFAIGVPQISGRVVMGKTKSKDWPR